MIVTMTGNKINYNKIDEDMISIKDMAISLCRLNRFLGHTRRSYSVAEHLYNCLKIAVLTDDQRYTSSRMLKLIFMHDLSEAYTGDIPSPLKELLPKVKLIESDIESAIYERFNIKPPTKKERELIKNIDLATLIIEMRDLTSHNYEDKLASLKNVEVLNIINKIKDSISFTDIPKWMSDNNNIRNFEIITLDVMRLS